MKAQLAANLLKDALRQSSILRLGTHTKISGVALQTQAPPGPVLGHWMTLVLLSSKSFRIIFKAHFMSKGIKGILSPILKKSISNVSQEEILDYMKEYCNLTGGLLKWELERNEIVSGLSVPLALRGFDEIFSLKHNTLDTLHDTWIVGDQSFSLALSSSIEILDVSGLDRLSQVKITDQSSGEFEIL